MPLFSLGQTHTTDTHYRHTLQTHTTDTHYRHTLQTHTIDTFLFISHTTNVLLFKSRCNIFIGFRIIKEMPGLVDSGTLCIYIHIYIYILKYLFISKALRKELPSMFPKSGAPMETDAQSRALLSIFLGVPSKGALS